MKSWNAQRAKASELGDHDVPILAQHLTGKRVALLITGGIAAIKAPMLARTAPHSPI